MNFSTAIVTVPKRLRLAQQLNKSLNGELIVDLLKNGSWWGHKQALLSYSKPYHLVLEDDVELCSDFIETIDQICGLFPEHPVSLFNMASYSNLNAKAKRLNIHFIGTNGSSGQGQLWPTKTIILFIRWCDMHVPESIPFEDRRLWLWSEKTNTPVFLTCPNLVQHKIEIPTTLGFQGPWHMRDSADYLGSVSKTIDWEKNLAIAKSTFFRVYDFSTFWKKYGFNT